MAGLVGLIITYLFVIITILIFVTVGVYSLFANIPNWKMIYASLAAALTMLVLAFLFYADDYGWLDIPNKLFDVLGVIWPILAIVIAVVVYRGV